MGLGCLSGATCNVDLNQCTLDNRKDCLPFVNCFLSITVTRRLQEPRGDYQIQGTVGEGPTGTVLLQPAAVHCGVAGLLDTPSVYVPG